MVSTLVRPFVASGILILAPISSLSLANAEIVTLPRLLRDGHSATITAGKNEELASAAESSKGEPQLHPLKGVVVNVFPEKQALLVKHEEVPGVMRAMTMLFKVEASALTTCKKGDSITGFLVRKSDGWWIDNVAVRK